jgi:3-mercaptopyruvate sulfurtransferase SseA
MLKNFGAEKVSILAGGLAAWNAMSCRSSRVT